MKNKIKTVLILAAFLFLFTGKVDAAVLSSRYILDQVKKAVIEQVGSNIQGRIVVESTGIPYKSIEVPEGNVEIKAYSNLKHFSSNTVVKTDILVNGNSVKSFGVPVEIKVYDKVWIAKDFINRDTSFSLSNIALEEKEISLMVENAARSSIDLTGRLSKKTLRPGDIVDSRYVENIPVVIKDNPVSVIFQSETITISLPALALESGKIGDYIKVRNNQYKKDYIGKVVGSNTVLVGI